MRFLLLLVCVQALDRTRGFLRREPDAASAPGVKPAPQAASAQAPAGKKPGFLRRGQLPGMGSGVGSSTNATNLMSGLQSPTLSCQGFNPKALEADLHRQVSTAHFPKKVIHDHQRHVFVAGLEGSGHHLWSWDIFHKCRHPGPCAFHPKEREALLNVMNTLWTGGGPYGNETYSGLWLQEKMLFTGSMGARWNYHEPDWAWQNSMRTARQKTVAALRELPPGLSCVNGLQGPPGQLSYPNYGGGLKFVQHPDVRVLAEVCEEADVDLRVVVINRNAYDTLVSTTVNRDFGGWVEEAVILEHNARVLANQLRGLDPAFIRCVNYETLPMVPLGLNAFLGDFFDLQATMKEEYHPHGGSDAIPVRHDDTEPKKEAVRFLQEGIDEIKRVAHC